MLEAARILDRRHTIGQHGAGVTMMKLWILWLLLLQVAQAAKAANPVKPWTVFLRTIKDARRHLVAAAVARSTSIFAMYPVDTFKTRIQMDQPNPLRLDGVFNGVGGSLLGQVPYGYVLGRLCPHRREPSDLTRSTVS